MTAFGAVLTADRPAASIARVAREVEAAGLDEFWLWEDCFLSGGIAASATALAATEHVTVGIGIMPAVFRNAAATAMEIATLANIYPGRFVAGLGHGVPAWMEQVRALPKRPVQALEEVALAVRKLLAGDTVTMTGSHVRLDGVRLAQAPSAAPPVVLGVRRRLGLRASGRSADGTILAEPAAPAYIRWARERIEEGRAASGRTDAHRMTVFVKGRIDRDLSLARRWIAEVLLDGSCAVQLDALDRDDDLGRLRSLATADRIAPEVPDDLVEMLTACGSAAQVQSSIEAVATAGADAVIFVPIGPDPDGQLQRFASEVVPTLKAWVRM